MKQIRLVLLAGALFVALITNAQKAEKKSLTVEDFAGWKVMSSPILSNDGKITAFCVNPLKGDGNLIVKTVDSKKQDTLSRAYSPGFSSESDFIVYKIKQPEDSIRRAKKKKVKAELMPQDSLGIFVFKHHKVYTYPYVKQYSLPKENASWVAFLADIKNPTKKVEKESGKKTEEAAKKTEEAEKKPEIMEPKSESTEKKAETPKSKKKKDKPDAPKTKLVLFQAATGDTISFPYVTEYYYSPKGHKVAFIKQMKDSLDRTEVVVFNTENGKSDIIFKETGTAKKIVSDQEGGKFGFLFSADTIKEKVYSLYYGTLTSGTPKAVVLPDGPGLPVGWSPSEYGDLSFSKNGQYLFFGSSQKPEAEPKDTLLTEDKPVLDVWSWTDKELQPEQKLNADKERKRTYKAVFLIDKVKTIQLGDPTVQDIRIIQKGDGHLALGSDPTPYKRESSWTGKSAADYYIVDVETGVKRMIVKNKTSVSISAAGNYVVWFNSADSAYYFRSTNINVTEPINLTSKIPVSFCDERWDMPDDANTYGIAGWSENDKYIFINDRYDIWKVDLEGIKVPVNATKNYGRKNYLNLRYCRLDPEEEFIDTSKPVLVNAFDERSKSEGYFYADLRNYSEPKMMLMEDYKFEGLTKAKNADVLIWTRENVSECPDLWTGDLSFGHRHRLSDANPQQKDFVWPGVRLVHWESFSGKKLEGLLYFPETIDPEKKYPMIVYFYERNANNLHSYSNPSPSRSIVNSTFYTSNNYIVFVPDIVYEDGYPGKSAFDAIVSGTQFVSSMFPFIDRKHIGMEGQSWGGYQTAWLITQTDMFAAASAGAPVSNMISAYGGIRWGSGVSRMSQYEHTQSRIGGTLWEKPMQFIENSPIFYIPKIKTPLLIMSNDNDGAVPWYQGIEMFTAMRRLNKPVWMLTYNNEEHNLKAESWANRKDLTIRMKQFFDYYLKGEPMPAWMQNGIPAVKKGKFLGY